MARFRKRFPRRLRRPRRYFKRQIRKGRWRRNRYRSRRRFHPRHQGFSGSMPFQHLKKPKSSGYFPSLYKAASDAANAVSFYGNAATLARLASSAAGTAYSLIPPSGLTDQLRTFDHMQSFS